MRCLFPQRFALGWIITPIQGSFCNQQSAEPTNQQINISTIQQLTASAGVTRAESPNYFSPIPQGWGIDIRTLFGGLKAWMKFILISSIAESGFNREYIRKHRPFDDFIINLLSALAAYLFFDKKPLPSRRGLSLNTFKQKTKATMIHYYSFSWIVA